MSIEPLPIGTMSAKVARDILFIAALDHWPDLKPEEFSAAGRAVIERAGPEKRIITLNEMSDLLFEELKQRLGEPVR